MSELREFAKEAYSRNAWVAQTQCKGLTHDDSLVQLPFRGNCLNWVLGHMLASRNNSLGRLGAEQYWKDGEDERYQFGSEPIVSADDPGIIPLEQLLEALDTTSELLGIAIDAASDEAWNAPWREENEQTLGQNVVFLAWHDTYHVGQTEYLRQAAGADDHII